jgi:hypothetical protein
MKIEMLRYSIITGLLIGITGSGVLAQTGGTKITSRLAKELTGEWRNRYVKIILNNDPPSDTSKIMEADSTNWEARLGIQPIRTHFNADGSFYSEYRNLKDSLVRRPAGNWTVEGDTLIMTQLKPDKSVLRLRVSIQGDRAVFTGRIDFEGDGKENDDYYGIQKKFK